MTPMTQKHLRHSQQENNQPTQLYPRTKYCSKFISTSTTKWQTQILSVLLQ